MQPAELPHGELRSLTIKPCSQEFEYGVRADEAQTTNHENESWVGRGGVQVEPVSVRDVEGRRIFEVSRCWGAEGGVGEW